MLPSGHIAAGYLAAYGALHLIKPELASGQFAQLLFWGAFFGFCPDLDMFYAFSKAKSFTLPRKEINHRSYLTHRPLFWLGVGGLIFIPAVIYASAFWQMFALMVWLGTWSHFVLDSFKVGIQWLWPIKNNFYAFLTPGEREEGPKTSFFRYWAWFLNYYARENRRTFLLEILILLTAAIVLALSKIGL